MILSGARFRMDGREGKAIPGFPGDTHETRGASTIHPSTENHMKTNPLEVVTGLGRPSKFKHSFHRCTGLVSVAALAAGCATQYRYGVNAINQPTGVRPAFAYQLIDVRRDAGGAGPAFARVAGDVRTALSSKGLFAAPAGTIPHLEIEVDFGISAPVIEHRIRTEPVVVFVPMASGLSSGQGSDLRGTRLQARSMGSRAVPYTITTYRKFLRLTAWEREPGEKATEGRRQIWSVHVSNQDRSNNLARHVRLMVAAAMDHIGSDLRTEKQVVLTMRDGRVVFVEQGTQ